MVSPADILNARILVVEDLEANVLLLKGMLRIAGYTSVESTTDPTEVCELHRKNRYSLILLDLQMPGMDGFEVMEGLKEIEEDGYLPVLVITAQPAHKLRALEAGAKDFVSKPFDLAEPRARVHNILEVRLLHLETRNYSRVLEETVRDEASRQLIRLKTLEERKTKRARISFGVGNAGTQLQEVVEIPRVCRPTFRPGIQEHERKAAVREARIPHVDRGGAHSEPMLTPERETEAVLRNVVTAIASPLRPGAMLAGPVLRTILLQRTMPLPGAVFCPSPLLLPRDCLLLGTLWLLVLLRSRLGTLGLLLLCAAVAGPAAPAAAAVAASEQPVRPAAAAAAVLEQPVGPAAAAAAVWEQPAGPAAAAAAVSERPVAPAAVVVAVSEQPVAPAAVVVAVSERPVGPAVAAVALRACLFPARTRVNRPEEHKQGSGTDNSNQLHRNHPPSLSLLCLHSDSQSA